MERGCCKEKLTHAALSVAASEKKPGCCCINKTVITRSEYQHEISSTTKLMAGKQKKH